MEFEKLIAENYLQQLPKQFKLTSGKVLSFLTEDLKHGKAT